MTFNLLQLASEECHALGASYSDEILKFSVICADLLKTGSGYLIDLYSSYFFALFTVFDSFKIKFGRQVEKNFKVPKERLFG